jgi:N-sulfoglucosamine sulfohydrolase
LQNIDFFSTKIPIVMSHKLLLFRSLYNLIFIFATVSCTPEADRPNILFAIADDASYPHMGAYGTDWIRTPAFDRVAREGLLFRNCYTPNAKCAPSRSAILTGRNSWQLEEAANHWPYFPQKFRTYAESLSENGYYVGYTAKGWGPGVALDSQGNRRQLTGIPFNEAKLEPPAQHINNIDYAENFRIFLDSIPDNSPFCFWYGSTEPHRAYEWQAGIRKGGKQLDEIDRVPAFWPDNDTVRTDLLDYAFEIEWFDQHLEKMLAMLEERGELANTLVVVTSDNGMPFPRVKGQVYEYSNHLPLAIKWEKGIHNPGREIRDFISFIDFAPTFLELAGIGQEQSGMQPITGKSFTDIFHTDQTRMVSAERNFVLVGKERHDVGRPEDAGYPVRGIIRDGYLYLMNFKPERWPAGNPETGYLNTDGSPTKTWILNERRTYGQSQYWEWNFGKNPEEELYNIREDPDCIFNLASQSGYSEIRDQLKIELARKLEAQEDPRILGNGEAFDRYLYSNESDRNFYERYMSGEGAAAGWVNESDFEKEKLD